MKAEHIEIIDWDFIDDIRIEDDQEFAAMTESLNISDTYGDHKVEIEDSRAAPEVDNTLKTTSSHNESNAQKKKIYGLTMETSQLKSKLACIIWSYLIKPNN